MSNFNMNATEQLQQILRIQAKFNNGKELICKAIHLGERMLENDQVLTTQEKTDILRTNEMLKIQLEHLQRETIRELRQIQRSE